MLRHDVVETVKRRKFQIYAVATVDEAIQLLTGIPAGGPLKKGGFQKNSVNARVEARLIELSDVRREFGAKGDEHDKAGGDGD
jgi:predicted ATP-dependent protease